METNEITKPLIFSKMLEILRDFDAIQKDKKNTQGWMFRGIDQFMNMAHGLFAKHGVFLTMTTTGYTETERKTNAGGSMYCSKTQVAYTFHAEDGSSVTSSMIGEAADSGDKAISKCYAIALKYCLMQTFLVPTEEMKDPDAETNPETIGKKQPAKQPVPDKPATPEQLTEIRRILASNPPYDKIGLEKISKQLAENLLTEKTAAIVISSLKIAIDKAERQVNPS